MRTKTLRSGPLSQVALVALGLACTLAPASWATQQEEETVVVGGQKLLRLNAPVGRIAIGDEDLARRYGALGFPTLVIVAPDGTVDSRHVGLIETADLEEALARQG